MNTFEFAAHSKTVIKPYFIFCSNVVVSQSAQNGIELTNVKTSMVVTDVTVNDNRMTGLEVISEPQSLVFSNIHASRMYDISEMCKHIQV